MRPAPALPRAKKPTIIGKIIIGSRAGGGAQRKAFPLAQPSFVPVARSGAGRRGGSLPSLSIGKEAAETEKPRPLDLRRTRRKARLPEFRLCAARCAQRRHAVVTTRSPTFDSLKRLHSARQSAIGLSLIWDSLMTASYWTERRRLLRLVASPCAGRRTSSPIASPAQGGALPRRFAAHRRGLRLFAEYPEIERPSGHLQMLRDLVSAEAEAADVLVVRLAAGRTRVLPMIVRRPADLLEGILREAAFDETTLEPPLALGAYRMGRFETAPLQCLRPRRRLLGKICRSTAPEQFRSRQIRIFRRQQCRLRSFKAGAYTLRLEDTASIWATGYDFPAVREKRVLKEAFEVAPHPGIPGVVLQHAAGQVRGCAGCARRSVSPSIRRTSKNLMFDAYKRVTSTSKTPTSPPPARPRPRSWRCSNPYRASLSEQGVRTREAAAGQRRLRPGSCAAAQGQRAADPAGCVAQEQCAASGGRRAAGVQSFSTAPA